MPFRVTESQPTSSGFRVLTQEPLPTSATSSPFQAALENAIPLFHPAVRQLGQAIETGGEQVGQMVTGGLRGLIPEPQPRENPPGVLPRVQPTSPLAVGARSFLTGLAGDVPAVAAKFATPQALATGALAGAGFRVLANIPALQFPMESIPGLGFLKRFNTPQLLEPLVKPKPVSPYEVGVQEAQIVEPPRLLPAPEVPSTPVTPLTTPRVEPSSTSAGAMAHPGYVLKGQPFEDAIVAYEAKAGSGTFDKLSPKAQLAVISTTPEAQPVKDIIRRLTGQVKTGTPVQEAVALRRLFQREATVSQQSAAFGKAQTLTQISQLFSEPRKFLKVAEAKSLTPTQMSRIARLQRVTGPSNLPLTPADLRRVTAITAQIVPRNITPYQREQLSQGIPTRLPGGLNQPPPRLPTKTSLVPYYQPGTFRDLTEAQTVQFSGLEPRRAANVVDQSPTGPTTQRWLALRDADIRAGQEWQGLNNELLRLSGRIPSKSPLAQQVTALLENTSKGQVNPQATQVAAWWRQNADSLLDRVNVLRASQGKTPIVRRGGYMTHLSDPTFWVELRATLTGESPTQVSTLGDLVPESLQPSSRFFKPRTGGPYAIDPIRAFQAYSQSLLRVIHASEPAAILSAHVKQLPPNAQRYFRRVIKQAVSGFRGDIAPHVPQLVKRPWVILTRRFNTGTVLGNASSVVMQPWTLPGTMQALRNPGQAGVAAVWIAQGQGGPFAEQWSKTLQGRLVEGLEPGLMSGYQQVTDKLAGAMTGIDRLMVVHNFDSHYLDQLALGKTHQEAVAFADDMTAKAQGEFLKTTLAPIFADEVLRGFVPFQTTINTVFNQVRFDILRPTMTQGSRWKDIGAVLRSGQRWRAAALFAGTAAALAAVYRRLGLPYPDHITDWIPGLSSLRGGPPILKLGLDVVGSLASPLPFQREQAWRHVLRSVGVVVIGPPGNQLIKSLAGIQAVERGGVYNARGQVKFPVAGLPESVRAVAFGPYQTKAGQAYIKRGFKPVPLTEEERVLRRRLGTERRRLLQ